MRFYLVALAFAACVDGSRDVPGASNICDTRLGPLAGCGPSLGGGPINQIRDACTKLVTCGIINVQAPSGRTFEDCVASFEGYAIDTLAAILDCISKSSCEQLHDPMSADHSICEQFGR